MILEQFLQVDVHQRMARYYREKGYILDIPSHTVKNEKNAMNWYTIIVNVNDLSPNARFTVTRICDDCGKIDIVKWNKHQFEKCYDCGHKREIHYQHCTECGKDLGHWNRNVVLCRECYQKTNKGENHHCYGKTREEISLNMKNTPKYKIKQWRTTIKERDNYTCDICRKQSKDDVVAHHLYDKTHFPEKIYDENNGITLCKYCHINFHNKYGHYGNVVTPEKYYRFKEICQNEHS
jgi:hypothetical protein